MIVLRPTVIRRNGEVKKLSPGWVPSPPLQTRSLAEESLQEGWSGCKGVVYIVEPATAEMVKLIAKDKFVREEILIPAVLLKVKSTLLFDFHLGKGSEEKKSYFLWSFYG